MCLFACGDNGGDGQQNIMQEADTEQSDAGTDISVPEDDYIYPDIDGGGSDFTFFSPSTTWGYYTDITRDEVTGEVLDDAVYNRNRFIEAQFNIEIKTINSDIGAIIGDLRRIITAGEDAYDAAFLPAFTGGNVGSLITENMLYNMYEIPTMDLERDWYNQTMIKEAAIGKGNQLYYAGCDINVMTVQCVVFIYFNQDMMTDLGLELPYNAAREGKWTYDLFHEYQKSGTNLNGADSFRYDAGAATTYGFVGHANAASALFEGSGERFIVTDSEGTPHPAIDGERFLNVLDKLEILLTQTSDGYFLHANNDPSTGFHFEPLMKNGRALMITGELKAADALRDMDATFGIVPIPKFDENQQDYFCHLHFGTPVLVIPHTNSNPEFTGAVLDAMAYVSARDVTPVLFDISMSQKRLRNEDSIEMLGLIRNSGSFDVGSAYGWTTDFYNAIASSLGNGNSFRAASQIERSKPRIELSIEKTMEFFD